MDKKVTIIDYGMSNTMSISRALEYCGAMVELTDSAEKIENANYLVLPGVGAFGDGMDELKKRNIIGSIQSFVKKDKPFLGICLGMQLMMDFGVEFGRHDGLKIIDGSVDPLPSEGANGKKTKVPHISWNKIFQPGENSEIWKNTILDGVEQNSYFYFVHSFYVNPKNQDNILALTPFWGHRFPSIIRKGNIYGVQFHPEKSGPVGLKVLENFLSL